MPAAIQYRYDCSGFIYTNRTRMGFSPKFTVTRDTEEDGARTDIVLWQARNHPEPTTRDIAECVAALCDRFKTRRIFLDGADGLVPVYDPPGGDYQQIETSHSPDPKLLEPPSATA